MILLSSSVAVEIPWQIGIPIAGLFILFVALALIAFFIEKDIRAQGQTVQESRSLSYLLFWPRGVIRYLKEYGAGAGVVCPQCGKKNPFHHLKFTNGKCLYCKTEISLSEADKYDAKYTALQKAVMVCHLFAWLGVALLIAFVVLLILNAL